MNAETFVKRLIGRAVLDADTLGDTATKALLSTVYDRDLEGVMVASERTSLTRQFAALILTNKSNGKVDVDSLIKGDYNTGILVEMAERALSGEKVGDTKALLDAYHAKLDSENADLPPEMKKMLENVANIPLEKPVDGEIIVKAPIVGDINEVIQAMPAQKPAQAVPKALNDIGGLNGIKDFVADLVFSDDTMVGDVTVNKKGETMRKILTSDRNVIALAEIIKDPTLIDRACAPEIADAVKDGLGKMVDILDAEFKKANGGKSLAVAATEEDFAQNLSLFLKDPAKLLGSELAKFDNLILAMANKGCENIQQFINTVFQVGNANANAQGSIVNEPYKNTSAKDLKTQLDGKNLNQILDSAANADAPGQIGFFRQIISTYFTSLGKADKRSCFAAAMRYAKTFDFTGLQGEKLVSAQQAAINKFTGAILKGTSPLLQKMMQGLPKDIMGKYADALDDMKSNLAPIPRKVVQAHFMKMINESKGKGPGKEIESIELKQSLGAASVGEAFLCAFKIKGEKEPRQLVVKIMRHDAERRHGGQQREGGREALRHRPQSGRSERQPAPALCHRPPREVHEDLRHRRAHEGRDGCGGRRWQADGQVLQGADSGYPQDGFRRVRGGFRDRPDQVGGRSHRPEDQQAEEGACPQEGPPRHRDTARDRYLLRPVQEDRGSAGQAHRGHEGVVPRGAPRLRQVPRRYPRRQPDGRWRQHHFHRLRQPLRAQERAAASRQERECRHRQEDEPARHGQRAPRAAARHHGRDVPRQVVRPARSREPSLACGQGGSGGQPRQGRGGPRLDPRQGQVLLRRGVPPQRGRLRAPEARARAAAR